MIQPQVRSSFPARPTSLNVASYLRLQAEAQAKSMAIAVSDRKGGFVELSYAGLEARSNAMAQALLAEGIARGTRCIVMVPPSPDFFALTFALFKIAAVPVFLDPAMGARSLKVCMSSVSPRAFIAVAKAHWARMALGWKPSCLRHCLRVGPGWAPSCTPLADGVAKGAGPEIAQVAKDELAAILFTSGSTGVPKGVEYTHGMFSAQVHAIGQGFGIQPGERDLSTFPLFALFGPALGMASVVPDMDTSRPGKSDPRKLLAAIEKYGCTSSFMSPALVKLLAQQVLANPVGAKRRLKSLRRVISAGAPSQRSVVKTLARGLDAQASILTPYGMTEAMPLTRIDHHELLALQDKGPGGVCVGRPLPGVELDIIEIDHRPLTRFAPLDASSPSVEQLQQSTGEARRLLRNRVGEIVVRSAVVSHRYWERPVATQSSKIGAPEPGVAHRSGDLGYLDEDGRLWVCGRKSHRVQSLDATYFTLPCEAVAKRVQGVKRAALVGLGPLAAQTPVMCVELESQADAKALQVAVLRALAEDPRTQGIERVLPHPGFPMDLRHNAKIHREALAKWASKKIN